MFALVAIPVFLGAVYGIHEINKPVDVFCSDSKVIEEVIDYNKPLKVIDENGVINPTYVKDINEDLYFVPVDTYKEVK